MYSKHQNLNAEPNKPGIDPWYHHRRRNSNALAALALIVIGILIGVPAGAMLSKSPAKPVKTCQTCHNYSTQQQFRNLSEYKRFHPVHP